MKHVAQNSKTAASRGRLRHGRNRREIVGICPARASVFRRDAKDRLSFELESAVPAVVNEDELHLETERLLLRRPRAADRAPFATMNADPRVMEYFPAPLAREDSDAAMARMESHFAARGFGLWAVEVKGGAPFIGLVGLAAPSFAAAFMPCVEISWRIAAEHWGRGFATEAARASLAFGFERLGLAEIVSFTTVGNVRSRRVMEKLGMARSRADDFEHPSLPVGHPLRPHVLYRLGRLNESP
jgi:RimJ/RimL family protein N-acetyltransferase